MAGIAHQSLKKRDPRVKVFMPSRMRVNAAWSDVCIHNVSARGLLVASDGAPEPGDYVEIRRGQSVIIGRALWKKDRFFGVRTQDRIDLAALQGEPARPGAVPGIERRTRDRFKQDAAVARSLERDRAFSRMFQFGVLTLAAGTASVVVGAAVYARWPPRLNASRAPWRDRDKPLPSRRFPWR